jgi:FMN phosphatase YigB (HAD superfamily)
MVGAQWVIKMLSLEHEIDEVGDSNQLRNEGVLKVNGLFQRKLEKLRIGATDLVNLGSSKEEDIIPAKKCGIFTIYYSEREPSSLDSNNLKISSFGHLEMILRSSSPVHKRCCHAESHQSSQKP